MMDKIFVDFNTSKHVMVQLTDFGREILRDEHNEFWASLKVNKKYMRPIEDENGWSKWQMWDLMEELGEHVGAGKENPFNPDIKIEINLLDRE